MDIWKILGIKPCKDKKEITNAYHEQLQHTNPEDKPEEFKELRQAYEEALSYCDISSSGTILDSFEMELRNLYDDFHARIDIENWKELLKTDICNNPKTKKQSRDIILNFLNNNSFIPHIVWSLLNNHFKLIDSIYELYETFDRVFVDRIMIDGIVNEFYLPLNLFEPGVDENDCRLYMQYFIEYLNNNNEDDLKVLAELSESHPYANAHFLLQDIKNGDLTKIDELKDLYDHYIDDEGIALYMAEAYYFADKYESCAEVIDKQKKNKDIDTKTSYLEINNLFAMKKYKEAKTTINDLYAKGISDRSLIYELSQKRKEINEILIPEYKETYHNNRSDVDNKIELAWSLIQNNCDEEAFEFVKNINEEETEPFDFYNLQSYICIMKNDLDNGCILLDKLINATKELKADNEKNIKRKKRLAEFIGRKALLLCNNKKYAEGFALYEEICNTKECHSETLIEYVTILITAKEFEKAEEVLKQYLNLNPCSYYGHQLYADILYKEGNDNLAYAEINRAIDLYAGDLDCFLLKCRILIRNHAKEACDEIFTIFDQNNLNDEVGVIFCRAYASEILDNNISDAKKLYEDAIKKIENKAYPNLAEYVYYRYLCLVGQELNANKEEDRKQMLDLCEKGLQYDEEHYGLLDYKAWLLSRDDKKNDALEIYQHLEKLYGLNSDIAYQIGIILYDDLKKNADDCLKYFSFALDNGIDDAAFYVGYTNFFMGNIKEAKTAFMKLRETNKQNNYLDVDSYYFMSKVYHFEKEFEKALEDADIALNHAKEKKFKLMPYYNNVIKILRCLNRFDEAIEYAKELSEIDEYVAYDVIADIYLQAGEYEKAKKYIRINLDNKKELDSAIGKLIDYYMLTGHEKFAKLELSNYKDVLDKMTFYEKEAVILENESKYKELINNSLNALELAKQNKWNKLFKTIQVAENYALDNDIKNKVEYALKAKALLKIERGKYNIDASLYHIAQARILICLGNYDEAEFELQKAREGNCAMCHYCACKDADTFEIYVLLAKGEYEKAKEAINKCLEKWPEEPEYNIMLKRIKK